MKKSNYLFATALLLTGTLFAQTPDDNDTNIDSHTITTTVPEVALLDLEGPTDETDADIAFDYTDNILEAGETFDQTGYSDNTIWLNYTSILPASGTSRKITVNLDNPANIPGGMKYELTLAQPAMTNGDGTPGVSSASTFTFQNDVVPATDQIVVDNVGSVYTGNGSGNGVNLTYTIVNNEIAGGNFASIFAQDFIAEFTYTLTAAL